MIDKIDHVVIFVTDMDRAVEFYTQIMGFDIAHPSEEYTSLIVPGDTTIGLHIAEAVAGAGSGKATTQVSFGVSNIEKVFEELQKRGVEPTREIQEIAPGRFMFNFTDPDGNQLSCFENRN